MKVLTILILLALLSLQQMAEAKGSFLSPSARRILMDGGFFKSSTRRDGGIFMPRVVLSSSSFIIEIIKSPEAIQEARQLVKTTHGDVALEKFNQMLDEAKNFE